MGFLFVSISTATEVMLLLRDVRWVFSLLEIFDLILHCHFAILFFEIYQ